MFLGDYLRLAQIVQGPLDGGTGDPQFSGNRPYPRPALSLAVGVILQVHRPSLPGGPGRPDRFFRSIPSLVLHIGADIGGRGWVLLEPSALDIGPLVSA